MVTMIRFFGVLAFFLVFATGFKSDAKEIISGPVPVDVIGVYDGDTFTGMARPWLGMTLRLSVRVDGVDTPELRGKCSYERELAREARNFVIEHIMGREVDLVWIKRGKYAGRAIGTVLLGDGSNLADKIIEAGLGRPYDGGKREGWCN